MENLEDMTLEERLQRLQRLQSRNTEDSLDDLVTEIQNDEPNDISNIEERLYRLESRSTPFRFSDYPRIRRHIIDRDTELYNLPPVVEDRYSTYDDEGSVRDMASSILAKRYKENRINHNIRTLKARDRFDIARIIEAGLPEEIGRKIARHRNKIDVHEGGAKSDSPNSKARRMRHNRLMRLDPEYHKTHMATRLQSMYRGKSARNRLSKRKSSKRIMESELEPEFNLLNLAPDIQETIGKNLSKIKLQKLNKQNEELVENYKNKVSDDKPLLYYSNLLNTQIGNTRMIIIYDDITNTTIMKIFNLPSNVANLLIGTIQHFGVDNLQKLLKFLAQDDNLNDFVFTFELTLKQSLEYTPLEIEIYINSFLRNINFRL
jgi:hypothetical protein